MEARTYLERVGKLNKLIENKLKEAEQWKAMAESTSRGISGERVQTSPSPHRMEDATIRFVEIEKEINQMIDKYIDTKQDIIKTIEMVEDASLYDLLHKKYIDGIPLTEIAIICDWSWESTKRKHKKALRIVQEILNGRVKDEQGNIYQS